VQPVAELTDKWVLLAEDQDVLREILADFFHEIGYRVLIASTGDEAMQALTTHGDRLSIVVSDVMMPGAGAMEVSLHLKENYPNLPLVLMSGYTREALEEQQGPVLCDLFLSKPFTLTHIETEFRRLLDPDDGPR
jgi:two-component system cell cycle sensor histidine kinase/response regulator CckA